MKKIISTFMLAALLLSGCGAKKSNTYVPEDVGEVINTRPTTTTATTKKKRQDRTTAITEIQQTTINPESTVSGETNENDFSNTTMTTVVTTAESYETETYIEGTEPTTEDTTEPTTEAYYLDGIVYEVHDKYILINETDFKKIKVSVSDTSKIENIQIGDTVEIAYNGLLNDGYISYAYDAYSVDVTRKATSKYEFKTFECNGLSFSMLIPENWSNKTIEYPQDSDFTDWGIRFLPSGENIGIDVSWHTMIYLPSNLGRRSKIINQLDAIEYTQSGVWRFLTFDNNYIIANNLYDSPKYSTYADEINFIISTIEFN